MRVPMHRATPHRIQRKTKDRTMAATYDGIIIGAGVMGATAALQL